MHSDGAYMRVERERERLREEKGMSTGGKEDGFHNTPREDKQRTTGSIIYELFM